MDEFFRRLLYHFRRRKFEAELDEEMLHHQASGQKQFGNVTLLKEDSRTMWTWTFWEQLGQDLRYALRTMVNNKTFTVLATLSLALGAGRTRRSTASWIRFYCARCPCRIRSRW